MKLTPSNISLSSDLHIRSSIPLKCARVHRIFCVNTSQGGVHHYQSQQGEQFLQVRTELEIQLLR